MKECPICGGKGFTTCISISDSIQFSESIGGKVRTPDKKKPIREFKYGDDYNRDRQKMVDLKREIDRENNKYYEKIVDKQTSEIIHECEEPLTEHQNRGNAKKK